MKAHGDARVQIYTATALGRGRVASPMLGRRETILIRSWKCYCPGEVSGTSDIQLELTYLEIMNFGHRPTMFVQ